MNRNSNAVSNWLWTHCANIDIFKKKSSNEVPPKLVANVWWLSLHKCQKPKGEKQQNKHETRDVPNPFFFILLTVSLNLLCFYIQQSSVYLSNSNHLILGEAVLQKFHFYLLFSKAVVKEFWSGIVTSLVSKNKWPWICWRIPIGNLIEKAHSLLDLVSEFRGIYSILF